MMILEPLLSDNNKYEDEDPKRLNNIYLAPLRAEAMMVQYDKLSSGGVRSLGQVQNGFQIFLNDFEKDLSPTSQESVT